MFPLELIEYILCYADYKTLSVAARVHRTWQIIVCRISKKRCHQNIPKLDLLDYKRKWLGDCNTPTFWLQLYTNWSAWNEEDLSNHIEFVCAKFIENPIDDVTCVSTYDKMIAIGLENGSVKVYNMCGSLMYTFDNLGDNQEEVFRLYFISVSSFFSGGILVWYEDAIFVNGFDGSKIIHSFQSSVLLRTYTVYENYFILLTNEHDLLLMRIANDCIGTVWKYSLQSEMNDDFANHCYTNLTNNICCLLLNSKLTIIYFENGLDTDDLTYYKVDLKLKCSIPRSQLRTCQQYAWIFHTNIIINIFFNISVEEEIMEVISFSDNYRIRCLKVFNPWVLFKALIYVVHLYGNTLVLGFSDGRILFYNIKSWNEFDLTHYVKSCQLPADFGPIRSIDVLEEYGKRIYYLTGNQNVYSIDAITILIDKPLKTMN